MLIIIMTFVAEPKLSIEYFRACGSSAKTVFEKAKSLITSKDKEVDYGSELQGNKTEQKIV